MKQELDGRVDQAFGHMMLMGLASILEQQGIDAIRIHWTNTMEPRPVIEADCDWEMACVAVKEYAASLSRDEAWLGQKATVAGKEKALFSPRSGQPNASELVSIARLRHEAAIDLLGSPPDWLSLRLIGSLGASAYWGPEIARQIQVDQGASRWEMKTRNRGEEFVTNRLAPVTAGVAARSLTGISEGLTGATARDEKGKVPAPDSRLPTGLRPPSVTDAVQAWCALMGLSALPVLPAVGKLTRTAGYDGGYSRGSFFLPVPLRAVTPAQIRAVVASEWPARFISPIDEADRARSASALSKRGIGAVVKFPLVVTGNTSAPERWAGTGRLLPTAHPSAERSA